MEFFFEPTNVFTLAKCVHFTGVYIPAGTQLEVMHAASDQPLVTFIVLNLDTLGSDYAIALSKDTAVELFGLKHYGFSIEILPGMSFADKMDRGVKVSKFMDDDILYRPQSHVWVDFGMRDDPVYGVEELKQFVKEGTWHYIPPCAIKGCKGGAEVGTTRCCRHIEDDLLTCDRNGDFEELNFIRYRNRKIRQFNTPDGRIYSWQRRGYADFKPKRIMTKHLQEMKQIIDHRI